MSEPWKLLTGWSGTRAISRHDPSPSQEVVVTIGEVASALGVPVVEASEALKV